jgi:UDP-glucose 4-epimerase
VACLRYFNPVGAHPSGQIGEDPRGIPNNLMPFISQVACGVRNQLSVFGNDYPTPDGTGVRDYIHVMDLARGHLAALQRLALKTKGRLLTVNLGTGKGISVLELVAAFERASGMPVPYQVVARRPGDVASCYADPALAKELLSWQAELDVDAMCADTWRWQTKNPHGYGD